MLFAMPSPPNVLLIMTDQHSAEVAGFAGDAVVQTPHLDELAAESVRFSCAVSPSPVCTPARMCLMTGREPQRCAAWGNHWIIFPEVMTWPRHFANHGYATALVGKMHFGGADQMQGFGARPYGDLRHGLGHQPDPLAMFPGYAGPQSAGVTEIPESLLADTVTSTEAVAWASEQSDREPERPWFMVASYGRPHPPLTAPARYLARYRGWVEAPPAPDLEALEPYARELAANKGYTDMSVEQRTAAVEAYYACVDYVDDCIGDLLRGLRRWGALDNTIVIYTADHGEMLGRHGMWNKAVYYEPATAIPLFIGGPGVTEVPRRVDSPISLIDLFPTVSAMCGLPAPEGVDGVDFSRVLGQDFLFAGAPRDVACSLYTKYGGRIAHNRVNEEQMLAGGHAAMRLARSARWKYVDIERGDRLLFDLQAAPGELTNLAADPAHADTCNELRGALEAQGSWDDLRAQLEHDRQRVPELASGRAPSTPNQYQLPDGRVFDAEAGLYGARWLPYQPGSETGGIIPQQFG